MACEMRSTAAVEHLKYKILQIKPVLFMNSPDSRSWEQPSCGNIRNTDVGLCGMLSALFGSTPAFPWL